MSKEQLEEILSKVWMRDWSADEASDEIWGEPFECYDCTFKGSDKHKLQTLGSPGNDGFHCDECGLWTSENQRARTHADTYHICQGCASCA